MAILFVDTSLRISIKPEFGPVFKSISLEYCPVTLSGLYHKQIELEGPIVICGMVKYCFPAFVLAKPPACAKYATFCRSVMLPAWDTTVPVFVSDPVTPEASARKALGWNG
jgi:hypothetical protein